MSEKKPELVVVNSDLQTYAKDQRTKMEEKERLFKEQRKQRIAEVVSSKLKRDSTLAERFFDEFEKEIRAAELPGEEK